MTTGLERYSAVKDAAVTFWRARPAVLRRTCLALVGAGCASLFLAGHFSAGSAVFRSLILPAVLGSLAGSLARGVVISVRANRSGDLDPADGVRLVIAPLVIIALVVRQVVPRMMQGAGYAMLGAALVSVALVLFHGLPTRDGRPEGLASPTRGA